MFYNFTRNPEELTNAISNLNSDFRWEIKIHEAIKFQPTIHKVTTESEDSFFFMHCPVLNRETPFILNVKVYFELIETRLRGEKSLDTVYMLKVRKDTIIIRNKI